MPDFFDVATAQRACRSFSAEPVDDAAIARILTAATRAPSAENSQPWVFVVVRDAALRTRIGALTRRVWEAGARTFAEGRLDPALLRDVDAGATGGVAAAPVIVVVCGDTTATPALDASIWPAVQNLLLAATALGLGSALTTLATVAAGDLAAALALPPHLRPMAVVPIGHPAVPLRPGRRRPVGAVTHRDRYGNGW